ncbi:type I glyceraldehyde-3-phosphate dehydrogenase [Staphylococcus pasteuri]|uniref:Glyceraldehyde-3-phosphate dehydrogenase n=3 Tax=Staphylococcus TaxID=1279 RepID=A0ABY1H7J1_9STAP|nr:MULTISPECIES: type I glyceraldehyde-3-phosphate dehydrogenase [Staphylococcus]RQX29271.1 type I glyceraldehyde-3-phosphate dehydrogenase [Staphylococcus warneri]ATH62439.1 type I glyceraldehyde-3-phosphate dehydrogenase [Staphylococcus pasteuri]KKI57604.1 NADPH-dependent glyceraldehyde-3-phosphate dehydrogenase [Staphylococcus pasteuri]MBL3397576.1 type I glyceraldehyde-3-phosphate dehydrogenase [Staphylococcus pasteuri]MBM6507557.1 type I glyceraldehyde-3-phosphate dehydrogenase [Staphyloc
MATNIAINGMGRIGRMVLRIALQNDNLNVKAINASYPPETIAHLINYDTTHGKYNEKVEAIEDGIRYKDQDIKLVSDRNPENLPWKDLDIDVVIEATGKFNHGDKAIAHINAGAKKVLLTGPSKGGHVQMIVKGVNDDKLDVNEFDIFSNASCTTNCIGPVAKVLNDEFGIVNGLMTTVHAITNDQKNIDNPHKDLRRARSCNESIIPTSTGAAKALKEVLPEVEGKLHGMALRVPTKNVSLVDLVVDLEKNVTVDEVNQAFKNANLDGVLDVETEPLVSVDFNTNPNSAVIDAQSTMVMGDNKVKVIAWYDNEWGYSNRVVEVAEQIGKLIDSQSAVEAV